MSRNDKDWTLVNDDGSFELDQCSSSSTKTKSSMDSDSDQDFEVLAKPANKCMTSQSLAKFKGIYIKEDHFAEGIDDGSDIEIIRRTSPVKLADEANDCANANGKGSIESVDTNTLSAFQMVDVEFINDIEEPVGEILSKEALDEVLNCKDECTEKDPNTRICVDEVDNDNKYEGLVELFKEDNQDKVDDCHDEVDTEVDKDDDDDVLNDIAALFDCHHNNYNDNSHGISPHDAKLINDGIILSSSMFIILLCLSLSAGVFIGKGFSCLSQSYQTYQMQTESNTINMKQPEAPKSLDENKRDGRFDLVNDSSLQSLSSESAKMKNETRETMTIRFAYQEMQLKYLRLEKKYRDLGQQYRAQKKVMFFSKKMQMINARKQSEHRKISSAANQSVADKELLWWKMRTAVWRRKYLDLKVKFLDAEKELARRRKANITFKACTGLLTRFIPELNVTSLLATNRIASGAKICWRKVVNPVKVVGEQMGNGLYGLSRKVDGFWAVIKSKWIKTGKEKDRSVKMTSKWRSFRRMFRMSNIIGSFGSRKSRVKQEGLKEKPCCEPSPVSFAKDRPEKWVCDGRIQERVSYPLPQSTNDLDETNDSIAEGRREQEDADESFRPCSSNDAEGDYNSKLTLNTGKRELVDEEGVGSEFHLHAEIEVKRLRERLNQMELCGGKRRGDLREKQEILERKMRKHSNKKRQERRMLKKREQKLKRKMRRVHEKLEKAFKRKINELKSKEESLQNELKKGIETNKQEKEALAKERAKFQEKVEDIEEKLRTAEEELQRRRTNFDKWSKEMRKKIVRDNAHGISKRYSEEEKLKRKHEKLVNKMKEKIERQKGKLEIKERAISIKVEQLRSVLRRLVKEEKLRHEQMKKKDEELKSRESQVEMVKLFYAGNLKREKEKHAEAKETVWQMKKRVVKLKEIQDKILSKYKNVQEKLSLEREKLKDQDGRTEIFYPTVYCPDQNSCKGRTIVKGYAYTNVIHGSTPSVFCPSKDSCNDQGSSPKPDDFQMFLNKQSSGGINSELEVWRRSTALHPVPPNSQLVKKVNPFFNIVDKNNSTTSREENSKPSVVMPEPEEPNNDKEDSNWYLSLMQERAKQRGTPLSWYLYWSQGRSSWRNAPGKDSNDNWFLKTMRERERQRGMPVDWYFKRGKGREENLFNGRSSWFLNRGKGREEARKKEGFYYCW